MLFTGLTGKGVSTLQGKSPSRSLHSLPLNLPPLSLAASWVGSSSPGGKAQDYNPLKEGGAQETLHGQLVRSLPQALNQEAALTLQGGLCVGLMAAPGRHQPPQSCSSHQTVRPRLGPHGSRAVKHDIQKANNMTFSFLQVWGLR